MKTRRCLLATVFLAACAPPPDSGVSERAAPLTVPQMVFNGSATPVPEYTTNFSNLLPSTIQLSCITGDPVLHIVNTAGQQVGMASGPTGSLAFRPKFAGTYTLVLTARSAGGVGVCSVSINGNTVMDSLTFAGWFVTLPSLRVNETIETVRLPNGAGPNHHLYLLSDATTITRRSIGGGTAGGAFMTSPVAGDYTVIVGLPNGETAGPVRVVRNDNLLADADGDGLGDDLETYAGTCSRSTDVVAGWACSGTTDMRDTDGDGIPDNWEVLGRRDMTPHQPLPLWGADPRHKDVFLEDDFMRRTLLENQNNVTANMPPSVARAFATKMGDGYVTDPTRQANNAATLRNPDGKTGIALHIDTGVAPQTSADATLYGDWGGFSNVPAVSDGNGGYRGQTWREAWSTYMSPARIGIFHYHLGYTTGSGSDEIGVWGAAYNFDSVGVAAHETGHTFGLGHGGIPYESPIDPNCKPNYASIMNYAFSYDDRLGFSDGTNGVILDNYSVSESATIDPNSDYAAILGQSFGYWIDSAGHVDWNRDGVIQSSPVKAYANFQPRGECEYTRYNQTPLGLTGDGPIALAQMGYQQLVFYTRGNALYYTYSGDTWSCPVPAVSGCSGASFNGEHAAGTSARSVAAVGTSTTTGVMAWVDPANRLFSTAFSSSASAPFTVYGYMVEVAENVASDVSLGLAPDGTVWGSWRGSDGYLYTGQRQASGTWTSARALGANGAPLYAGNVAGGTALITAKLAYNQYAASLYALFPNTANSLYLYVYDPVTTHWTNTNLIEGDSIFTNVYGRPAMAWMPFPSGYGEAGRLFLFATWPPADPNNPVPQVLMDWSYVKTTGTTKQEVIGMRTYFDNSWYGDLGFDVSFQPGYNSDLRYVSVRGANSTYQLNYRPKAAAFNDYTYTDNNDWRVLAYGVCAELWPPGTTPTVGCHPRDY